MTSNEDVVVFLRVLVISLDVMILVIVTLSYLIEAKLAIWSFIPLQIWQFIVLISKHSVVDIEDQDSRHYQILITIGLSFSLMANSWIFGHFLGKYKAA